MSLIFSVCYLCGNNVPEQLHESEPCEKCRDMWTDIEDDEGGSLPPMDIDGIPYTDYEEIDLDAYDEEAEKAQEDLDFHRGFYGEY